MIESDPQTSHWLIRAVVSALAVLLTSKVVPGFEIRGFLTAFLAAILIAVLNFALWWILFLITLPLTVLTLGLFAFFINAIILKICSALLPGFEIRSWWAAILGSFVLAVLNVLLHYVLI